MIYYIPVKMQKITEAHTTDAYQKYKLDPNDSYTKVYILHNPV